MTLDVEPNGRAASIPIAIVGMSCRFAGDATSSDKLWQLCANGQSAWSRIPRNRFNQTAFYHADSEKLGTSYVEGGHFMKEDIGLFDAAFFNFSAEVASATGIPIDDLAGSRTSVFVGCFSKDYHDAFMRDPELLPPSFLTGNGAAMLSNRISHFFDLRGISVSMDTGCSSALTAVHLACQSLRAGESETSIVGASAVLLNPDMFITMSSLGILSSAGKCFSWDSRADGYGRGEGVSSIVLKPLDAALRDGDHIHAVIRETAVNQDGKTATITSPSKLAQQELIRDCYARAGLDPLETCYVEAHMTGTLSGDSAEAEAIGEVFGKGRPSCDPVLVGSVKTNIGHTEAASGLAAIMKVALILQNRSIPPNLNFEKPNKDIDLERWNLKVPTRLTEWPSKSILRASINNFGYGGTNAHVIMDPAPNYPLDQEGSPVSGKHIIIEPKSRIFVVSGKDSVAAQSMIRNISTHIQQALENGEEPTLADLAYTLGRRRSKFSWVAATTADNLVELAQRFEDPFMKPSHAVKCPRVAFVFNGQGAQWYAMGRELLAAYPVFRHAILEADRILGNYGSTWSLLEELMRDEKSSRVHESRLGQPMSVALQMCLVELLKSWGVQPSAVTSHSSGEIAAAYAVGALTFREALGVVFLRGELADKYQKLTSLRGGMLAVGLGAEQASRYLAGVHEGRVVVACINSPSSVTLSGDLDAITEVESRLQDDGVFARRLKVPLAYHSHHMQHMADEYTKSLEAILPSSRTWSGVPYSSPVTGGLIESPEALGPDHWVRNLTSPVLFAQSFETMCFGPDISSVNLHVDVIVEIGAHSTLSGPIRQIIAARQTQNAPVPYLSCLSRQVDAVRTMQDLACSLLCRSSPLDLRAVNSPYGEKRHRYIHNLPSYAWNHNVRYWKETIINKEHRNRKHAPHELLGAPTIGTNPSTPTWRRVLRLRDLPWLRDHKLESMVVLPGAAYITMAIEATRQITDPSEKSITGYKLQDVDITNALAIPNTSDGVEIRLCFRPRSERELDANGWHEFELYSLGAGDSWILHCKGCISAETPIASDNAKWAAVSTNKSCEIYSCFGSDQIKSADLGNFYASLRDMGIYHGPSFQNLIDSQTVASKAITTFKISSVTQDYVLHPTTLDSIIQSTYQGLSEAMQNDAMVIPRSIQQMSVSRDIKRHSGGLLKAFTNIVRQDRQGFVSSIAVRNDGDSGLSLKIDGLYCQAIEKSTSARGTEKIPKTCFKSRWEPELLLKMPASVKDTISISLSSQDIAVEKKLLRASWNFIHDAMNRLKDQNTDNWSWHAKIFYEWMKLVDARGLSGDLAKGSQAWSKTSKGLKQLLLDETAAESVSGRMVCRIGEKLAEIVRGEVAPLELMMEGNLLHEYYQQTPRALRVYNHVKKLVRLFAVKNPFANVLEIGAGTGGCTSVVLEALGGDDRAPGPRFAQFDFTDISSGFFEMARQKFAFWGNIINFKKLDIESDPREQAFGAANYDLVVACLVLHATRNLHNTLSNVRKLLKPGGRLLLIEITQDRLDTSLAFGTLPGWWLSEEPERRMSPNTDLATWNRVLQSTGFTGIDFDIGDCEDKDWQSCSVIMSTAKITPSYPFTISIVYAQSPPPHRWLEMLAETTRAQFGLTPLVENLDCFQADNKVCIFTAEMQQPLLHMMDPTTFASIQSMLINSRGVLWLSRGGIFDAKQPLFALHQGLLRSLRLENNSKRYASIDFEQNQEAWADDDVNLIVHVLRHSFDFSMSSEDLDFEYAAKDSILHVSRIYHDIVEDRAIAKTQTEPEPVLEPFHQSSRDLVMEFAELGILNSLRFTDSMTSGELPAGYVEIEPKAFGLNFRDVLVALGKFDETIMGHECSGIVTRLGPETSQSGLCIGDRVCAILKGHFASRVRTRWTHVGRIPENMSFERAASFPIAFATAYHSLYDIANLKKGETVLIHAASGGLGQAGIMLAQRVGAEVFVTCGTELKRDLVIEKYGIKPDHVFSSRNASFASTIMAMTNGKGIDVVLNSLAGPLLKATWDCIARFGRFVEVGKVDLEAARRLDMTPFIRGAAIFGVDILLVGAFRGKDLHRVITNCLCLFQEQAVSTVSPITSYYISETETAFRQMQSGNHTGKIVIIPRPSDQVKVVPRQKPVKFSPHGSYLVAGGLGGIGRAIARWLVQKGAKHILLLSRSAESHLDGAAIIQEGRDQNCDIKICSCDIAEEASLAQVLADCRRDMPPIRGVITGAMVLNDSVFERMSVKQWKNATLPKVQGTLNLHNCLPDLDFFIMLSSLIGVIGNASQGNYGAGGTFQDAFARYRTACGLPAISIDLGIVKSVGFVAEAESAVAERNEKLGIAALKIENVLRIIESAVRKPLRSLDASQVITGLVPFDERSKTPISRDRRFSPLHRSKVLGTDNGNMAFSMRGGAAGSVVELKESLAKAATFDQASDLVTTALIKKLSEIFTIPEADIDKSLPMQRFGVDSLVAVELRNWLTSAARAMVSTFDILQSISLTEFGGKVAEKSEYVFHAPLSPEGGAAAVAETKK